MLRTFLDSFIWLHLSRLFNYLKKIHFPPGSYESAFARRNTSYYKHENEWYYTTFDGLSKWLLGSYQVSGFELQSKYRVGRIR